MRDLCCPLPSPAPQLMAQGAFGGGRGVGDPQLEALSDWSENRVCIPGITPYYQRERDPGAGAAGPHLVSSTGNVGKPHGGCAPVPSPSPPAGATRLRICCCLSCASVSLSGKWERELNVSPWGEVFGFVLFFLIKVNFLNKFLILIPI